MADLSDSLSLELSDDETVATLVVQPGAVVSELDKEIMVGFLSEHAVLVRAETHSAVEVLAQAIRDAPNQVNKIVVARGAPARHGENGRLVWEERFDPEREPEQPPEHAADAKKESHYARSVFTMAKPGDVVATLVPPTPGADGETVKGKVITARSGKPADVTFDDSVRVADDGRVVVACAGAVGFKGGALTVRSHLEIDEYVDFSTGNIDFDGDVTVLRGVRDCFVVQATKNVNVRGMVEAARIIAGRDVKLDGGMAAREKGSVLAERDLSARYLDSVEVVVGRDASIDKEIVNADLSVGRGLACPRGALIGGVVAVGGASEFAEIGSPGGVETRLRIGAMREFDVLSAKLQSMAEAARAVRAKAGSEYNALRANAARLTSTQAERLTELQFTLATIDAMLERMARAAERVGRVVADHTEADLTVHKMIHCNVRLVLGGVEAHFRDPLKGPVRITLSPSGRPQVTDLFADTTRELSEFAHVQPLASPSAKAA